MYKLARLLAVIVACLATAFIPTMANDGVYFTSGNHLIPLRETDISVQKEVLTIALQDDGMATVDVYYEFYNRGNDKQVLMGFEAMPPYNADAAFNPKGIHPFIHDFTIACNGQPIRHKNAVALIPEDKGAPVFDAVGARKDEWCFDAEGTDGIESMLYNAQLDSLCSFAYVYYFDAQFQQGINRVHHTYRYDMSYGAGMTFSIDYLLSPATRWANHAIDDFTLRIQAKNTAKNFAINDSAFLQSQFRIVEGMGKMRHQKLFGESVTEFTLRNGTVEWHATHFAPRHELYIVSADELRYANDRHCNLGEFYDRSAMFVPSLLPECGSKEARILRNLPYAHRGYVFKDKELARFFDQQWWYMPDPTWQPSTQDFTPSEREYIQQR